MDFAIDKIIDKSKIKIYLLDLIILGAIYLIQTFSHLFNLPVFIKTNLISAELLLNVFLFYKFKEQIKNTWVVFALALIISKLFYYSAKYFLLNLAFLEGSLISTPIIIQVLMVFIFTSGFYFLSKKMIRKYRVCIYGLS